MAPLESLPPDQRAVLQLVLQRGRSYDEIAAMLSIDRAAVRDRALSAFDAIGPPTRVAPERRALITDYLMGQLPPRIAEQIFERLKTSPAERAWARALASDLSTLAKGPLPEIPSSVEATAPPSQSTVISPTVAETARTDEETTEPEAEQAEEAEPAPAPRPRRRPPSERVAAGPAAPSSADGDDEDAGYGRRDAAAGRESPPSSRRGGAILILGGVLVAAAVIVVAIILTNNSGSSKSPAGIAQTPSSASSSATTPTSASGSTVTTPTSASSSTVTASTSTPTGTGTSAATTPAAGTTGTSGSGTQLVAQLDLKAPSGAKSPVGVAQIVKQGAQEGIVLVATGVAPNTKHNAYAVWLYASPSQSKLLGFVNPAVKAGGRLQTAGVLPTNASIYHQVLVTVETQPKPTAPGTVILRGALNIR